MEEKSLSYFRIKTEYTAEGSNGALEKRRIEELALATCYTEVESLAEKLIEMYSRNQFSSVHYEIIKTKIADVFFNENLTQEDKDYMGFCCSYFAEEDTSAVGLYAVKVVFLTADEKTAKNKQITEVFYVPASSNADATARISRYLADSTADFVIRDTKFDKAEAIYWPVNVQNQKVNDYSSN